MTSGQHLSSGTGTEFQVCAEYSQFWQMCTEYSMLLHYTYLAVCWTLQTWGTRILVVHRISLAYRPNFSVGWTTDIEKRMSEEWKVHSKSRKSCSAWVQFHWKFSLVPSCMASFGLVLVLLSFILVKKITDVVKCRSTAESEVHYGDHLTWWPSFVNFDSICAELFGKIRRWRYKLKSKFYELK